ncbi:MAG: hypothetical protein ACRENE_02345 [Polyangiaceae bacterium]
MTITTYRSPVRGPRALAVVLAAATSSLLAFPREARAEARYPGDVDMALGKPMIVETKIAPTMGCQLCHTSSVGGTTTLTPFANEMIARYDFPKAMAVEDANVLASLAKLEAAEPKLWADMQAGIDPNTDPVFLEGAPPSPEYGCSSAGGRAAPGIAGVGIAWACGIALALRRRRRRAASPAVVAGAY